MLIINARSVSNGLHEALWCLHVNGVLEDSRVGKVLALPCPATTVFSHPTRRVLFSPMRDANPFFHLMEALWMLKGRNDLAFPLKFNKRFGEYSDDGSTIWGAYGWRWRDFFEYDQLDVIVDELKKNPASRRCVLAMWNAMPVYGEYDHHSSAVIIPDQPHDLYKATHGGKDVPCNTHAYFDCRGGKLNMTVCNRSNDVLWGCYGANAVHFSILQEYMAARIGVPIGVYRQMSNNLHLYTDIVGMEDFISLAEDVAESDRYHTTHPSLPTMPLVDCPIDMWEEDLHRFFHHGGLWNEHVKWNSEFIGGVAVPMYRAHSAWREKDYDAAMHDASIIKAWDWRFACVEWLERRATKRAMKEHAA